MFELKDLIRRVASSSTTNRVLSSPIFTGLLIAIIVMIVIYFTFRGKTKKSQNFAHLIFQAGVYSILGAMSIIFLHNQTMMKEYENLARQSDIEDIMAPTTGAFEDNIPIFPANYEGEPVKNEPIINITNTAQNI